VLADAGNAQLAITFELLTEIARIGNAAVSGCHTIGIIDVAAS
jgi:hypothetical protein